MVHNVAPLAERFTIMSSLSIYYSYSISMLQLIEKDDPDTCHHMVHRVTDGIPCVRERTDFCCEYTHNIF